MLTITLHVFVNTWLLAGQEVEPPKVLDERISIELVAREPDIVTPTGIAVDAKGRVFVIENHTHQRERNKKYEGPSTDRIKIFDGGKPVVFAEGFRNGMSLRFGPDGVAARHVSRQDRR